MRRLARSAKAPTMSESRASTCFRLGERYGAKGSAAPRLSISISRITSVSPDNGPIGLRLFWLFSQNQNGHDRILFGQTVTHRLERRNNEQQAGYDRESRYDCDQSEQEHDDSEGTLVQAVHQPAQSEVVRRYFIMQPLQHDGSWNKHPGFGQRSRQQRKPPNLIGIGAPSAL
jgi:hypothetical protein